MQERSCSNLEHRKDSVRDLSRVCSAYGSHWICITSSARIKMLADVIRADDIVNRTWMPLLRSVHG